MNLKHFLTLLLLLNILHYENVYAFNFNKDPVAITKAISIETFVADNQVDSQTSAQNGSLLGLNIKPNLGFSIENSWEGYFEGQLYSATTGTSFTSEDKQKQASDFIGLRELWIGHRGWTPYPGENIRTGIERKRINNGIILDAPISGLSWNFDTSLLQSTLGLGQRKKEFRTDELQLNPDVRELNIGYAQARFKYHYANAISAYVLHGNGDKNPLHTDLTWSGIGIDNGYYIDSFSSGFSYTFSVHAVTGEQFDSATNIIHSVKGYANDSGVRWQFVGDWTKTIGVQYAEASGGADGYRPTGLETNRLKFTGTNTLLYRFNDALRADWRNLNAITVYTSVAQYKQWDINIAYNHFSLHNAGEPFYILGSAKDVPTEGTNLGHGIDVVLMGYLNRSGPSLFSLTPFDSSIRLRFSTFNYDADMQSYAPTKTQYSAMLSWIIQL